MSTWPPYSQAQCIGDLEVAGLSSPTVALVRNMGGGTSQCCSHYPIAAPARVHERSLELPLLARRSRNLPSRNSARVYVADECLEGQFRRTRYAALPLLGNTISITVDLSAASCGCNSAWYLASLAQNHEPGVCGGDYYCDANNVCNVRCSEIDMVRRARRTRCCWARCSLTAIATLVPAV